MGDATIKDAWSEESEREYQKSLRGRGLNKPTTPDTIFKGKIGIEVNIVFDDGNNRYLDRVISIPGKYFGNLTAVPENDNWYEMGDFAQVEIPELLDQVYFIPTYTNNQVKIIDNEEVREHMKKWVLKEIFNPSNPSTPKAHTPQGPLQKSAYFVYDSLPEYGDFYIYPNSPADKWIDGIKNPPRDHLAPPNFGVSYTIVRKSSGLIQGGNPNLTLKGTRLNRDDQTIPNVDVVYTAPTIKFGGVLKTTDFGIAPHSAYGRTEQVIGVPVHPDGTRVDLLFYKGPRNPVFEKYLVDSAQLDLDSNEKTKNLLVDLAGSDAEGYVLPKSDMEQWIMNGDDSIPAPDFVLQYKLEVYDDPEQEQGLEVNEDGSIVEPPKSDYVFEESGGEVEGNAPKTQADTEFNAEINREIDELERNYQSNLDNQRPPYKLKDIDGDGDYKEASDLFGTRQGDEIPMNKQTSFDFQEGAKTDYYRPFDEYDNLYHEVEENITESKVITKKELIDFQRYSDEAYMPQYEFDRENQYEDGRKRSYLIIVKNAEARIYDYYDEEHQEKRLIIAFRGTTRPSMKRPLTDTLEFSRDLMTDLTSKVQNLSYIGIHRPSQPDTYGSTLGEGGIHNRKSKLDFTDLMGRGIVHQGFADYVNYLYRQLVALIKSQPKGTKLYICGHSLGAGASAVFSYMLFKRENIIPTRIYQFGSPMGIWTFGDELSKNLPIISVIHTHDVICPVSAMFKHHGTKLVFDLDGNLTTYPPNLEVPLFSYQDFIGERLLLALRKNGAFRTGSSVDDQVNYLLNPLDFVFGRPDGIVEPEYDQVINYFSGFNLFSNIGAVYQNFKQPAQRRALMRIKTILSESGTDFYHGMYKEIVDGWKNKQVNIEEFKYFAKLYKHDPNPRGYHHKYDKDYHSSIGDSDFYTDSNGDLFLSSNSIVNVNFHPLNNTEPLGFIFYDKNMNISDKAIVFNS